MSEAMRRAGWTVLLGALAGLGQAALTAAPISALIIDGQNNHDWKSTTPALKKILKADGRECDRESTAGLPDGGQSEHAALTVT